MITAESPSVTKAQRRLSNRHHIQEDEVGMLERPPTRRGGSVHSNRNRNYPTTSNSTRTSGATNNMRFELMPGVKVKHADHIFKQDSGNFSKTPSQGASVRNAYDTTSGYGLDQRNTNFQATIDNNNRGSGFCSLTKRNTWGQQPEMGDFQTPTGSQSRIRAHAGGASASHGFADEMRMMGGGAQARLSRQCHYPDSDDVVMYDEVTVAAGGGRTNKVYQDQVTHETYTDLRQKLNKINNVQPPRCLDLPTVKHETAQSGMRYKTEAFLDSDLERFQALNIKTDESINNNNKRFQPFLEKKNCICLRALKIVSCKDCSKTVFARIMKCCPLHPEDIYLMDVKNCGECRGMNLTEYIIPPHIDVSKIKKNTIIPKN